MAHVTSVCLKSRNLTLIDSDPNVSGSFAACMFSIFAASSRTAPVCVPCED